MKRSLRSWLWRVDITQEVDEEIAFHVEMRTPELTERGVPPAVAREMLSRYVTTLVYPVTPLDPVTFVAVPIVLLVTAAIAVAAPAWRAARVDPVVAFRVE